FLAAAPSAARVLEPDDLARWGAIAPLLRAGLDDGLYFRALPGAVSSWSAAERAAWLRAVETLARRHVPTAVATYRDFPATLSALPPPVRAALLDVLLAAAAGALPSDLAGLLPVAATLVADVPRHGQAIALELARRVADDFPAGVAPLVRALPRLFEEGTVERFEPWLHHGLGIADENADAGRAYFALESQTSVAVLRASPVAVSLDEAQSVLRKVVQMLSGTPASPRP